MNEESNKNKDERKLGQRTIAVILLLWVIYLPIVYIYPRLILTCSGGIVTGTLIVFTVLLPNFLVRASKDRYTVYAYCIFLLVMAYMIIDMILDVCTSACP